ncbi:hypothetical protein ACHAXA_005195 [Cyclostephanos tholiformis]|uniref:Uncharacterized protein n=1 Tax=Cyclostephanos tholiformis TaxID=382380 RepID=A0ABD3RU09_9STRA
MNGLSSLASVCDMYQRAASYTSRWRMLALDFLGCSSSAVEEGVTEDNDVTVGDGMDANKWVELLILNGALDVEYIGGDVDHVDNEEGEEKNEDETENDDGVYSSSGSLLNREKRVTHPIISSVMYLTGAGRHRELAKGNDAAVSTIPAITAGSTVVFNQTPESMVVAPRTWVSHPRDNAFMVFPGNLLHGVLPCGGAGVREGLGATIGGINVGKDDGEEEGIHWLTLMIGFWTRNVIEGMVECNFYTPCGPMPPPVSEHSWVIQARKGY